MEWNGVPLAIVLTFSSWSDVNQINIAFDCYLIGYKSIGLRKTNIKAIILPNYKSTQINRAENPVNYSKLQTNKLQLTRSAGYDWFNFGLLNFDWMTKAKIY